MEERRKPTHEITAQYEDAGIYKREIVQMVVHLVPCIGQNSRQDILVKGFVDGDGAIDVVFPGRRKAQAKPILTRLQLMYGNAKRASMGDAAVPAVDSIRLPVRIEGAWRPRFERDDLGWETKQNQLYAARWLMNDMDGNPVTYGEIPAR